MINNNDLKSTWHFLLLNPKKLGKIFLYDVAMIILLILVSQFFENVVKIDPSILSSYGNLLGPLLVALIIFILLYVAAIVFIFSAFQCIVMKEIYNKKINFEGLGSYYLANFLISLFALVIFLIATFLVSQSSPSFILVNAIIFLLFFIIFFYLLFSLAQVLFPKEKNPLTLLKASLRSMAQPNKHISIIAFTIIAFLIYYAASYLFASIIGESLININNADALAFAYRSIFFTCLYILTYLLFFFNRFYFYVKVNKN